MGLRASATGVLVGTVGLLMPTVAFPTTAAVPEVDIPAAGAGAGQTVGKSRTLRTKVRTVKRHNAGAAGYRARARAVVRHRIVLRAPDADNPIIATARAARVGKARQSARRAAARSAVHRAVVRSSAAARRKAARKLAAKGGSAVGAPAAGGSFTWPGDTGPDGNLPASLSPTAPASPPTALGADRRAAVVGLNVWDEDSWDRAESQLGFRAGVVGLFADFAHAPDFPRRMADLIVERGGSPLIAWEPWDSWTGGVDQPDYRLRSIIAGEHDGLIRRWAAQVDDFGHKVLIRFAPEMNGDWRPWSPGVNGNTAAQYSAAWRHVVGLFAQEGAHNAVWVWNPIVESGGQLPMAEVYPGDDVVDLVALDGYNWGSTRSWGWQGYDDVFAPSVAALGRIAPGKPWLIAEVGCAPGGGKADWIVELFARARADGARAVVWFEFDKETDWRLSENRSTSAAARESATRDGWLTGGDHALIESQW